MGKTLNFEQNSGKFQSAHGLRSRKIRIISPNGLSDAGGVERVMLYAYRALSEHGFRVDIIDQKPCLEQYRSILLVFQDEIH